MVETDKIYQLKETFLRVISKFKALEKIPVDHGTGDLLYASEVNTLEVIGKFPGINLTQLAQRRGVTKGAVSQIVAKLVKKKLVARTQAPDNDKVVLLVLTGKGEVVFENHELFHRKYDAQIIAKLAGMSGKQFDLVTGVFVSLEETVDAYLKDLE